MGLGFMDGFPPQWHYMVYETDGVQFVVARTPKHTLYYPELNFHIDAVAAEKLEMLTTTEALSLQELLLFVFGENT